MPNTPISTHKAGLVWLLWALAWIPAVGFAQVPVTLTPKASLFNPLDHPPFTCKPLIITELVDDCRFADLDDLLEEYEVWDESIINPYGIRLAEMPDTLKFDMRGYVPPTKNYITSDFGFRKGSFHYGIDLKVNKGDHIYCAFDGQVRIIQSQRGGYGQYVVIRHYNGLETLYAHLSKILVTPGQTVRAGEVLGLGGRSGHATGYHLHFETRYVGNVIDPNDLYDFETGCVKSEVFLLSAHNFDYVKEVEKIRFWTVRQGDTLGKIASKTGVSVPKLCNLNNIKSTSILKIGQKIRYS
ncbi:MAG: M23 family metallopeptidase [Bacteroidetes bacterium]|nr:M23 family metallopeptidase [Bacteroidota bacterium]